MGSKSFKSGLIFTTLLAAFFAVTLPANAVPFACDGEAYMSHEQTSTQLSRFEQRQADITGEFTATNIGAPATNIQYDNLGFNEADGLLYGWRRSSTASLRELVSINATGAVTLLGVPTGMSDVDVFAGDVSNNTMYLANLSTVYTVDLTDLTNVTPQSIAGVVNSGNVVDWA
jgi:hypothetical protein